jgi:hypothetical protein
MLITRKAEWYRPYYVTASNREYKVEKIHFYKDNKILVSTSSGWLENQNGRDIERLELPIDEIKTKRKESFDGTVFVISQGKESYTNELLGELYIPADMLNVHFVENKIEYITQIRAIYKGVQGIYISAYVKSIDGELKQIRKEYEEIYKACDGYNLGYHTDGIIEKLDNLKALAEQYVKAKQQMESLTIDDIEV